MRLRKEDCISQTSLGYIMRVRFHFNKPKQQENTTHNKINIPPKFCLLYFLSKNKTKIIFLEVARWLSG